MIKRSRVLLVEDDGAVRDALKMVLTSEDFDVTCAASRREALLQSEKEKFEVAVLDLNLEQEDGWKVFHELKGIQGDLPIVVTSAEAGRLEHDSAPMASGLLEKPFDMGALIELLRKASKPASEPPLAMVAALCLSLISLLC